MRETGLLAALAIVSVGSVALAQSDPRAYTPRLGRGGAQSDDAPTVQVWLDERSYGFGDIIRPYVATESGAYLTVIRVSTDGELKVLYPARPSFPRRFREGQFPDDKLPLNSIDQSFYVRESAGSGFVFVIATFDRMNYSYYTSGNQWSYARLAGANRFGNPFQIARSFIEQVTTGDYSMDYVMYDVDGARYRSRYASRYRHYANDDYLDLCLGAFDSWFRPYCRAYDGGHYGPYVIVNYPLQPQPGKGKSMRVRRVVPDPVLPHRAPAEPHPLEGRLPTDDPAEEAAAARRDQMPSNARPRIEPRVQPLEEPRIYRPQPDPAITRRSPVSEPRYEPPRIEQRRPDPSPVAQPRVEVRNDPPPQPPPRQERAPVEQPQKKDN